MGWVGGQMAPFQPMAALFSESPIGRIAAGQQGIVLRSEERIS